MSNIRGILLPRRSSVALSKSTIFFFNNNYAELLHEILIEKNHFYCFSNSKPNCNPSYWFNNEVAALIVELELPKAPPMV